MEGVTGEGGVGGEAREHDVLSSRCVCREAWPGGLLADSQAERLAGRLVDWTGPRDSNKRKRHVGKY